MYKTLFVIFLCSHWVHHTRSELEKRFADTVVDPSLPSAANKKESERASNAAWDAQLWAMNNFMQNPDVPSELKWAATMLSVLAAGGEAVYNAWKSQHVELEKQMEAMQKTMKEYKLENLDDLQRHDGRKFEALVTIAKNVEPMKMSGQNIAFFGQTSTGKSTIINSLLGKEVAETGYGEVTVVPASYKSEVSDLVFWDMPGKNDEVSYLYTVENIGFWKGLSRRMIVIQNTIKEMTKTTQLLDQMNLDYDIVVNKFDYVKENDRQQFKQQIQTEAVRYLQNGHTKKIWFISAEKVQDNSFDWLKMVDS